jgi:hypothetical protein
VIYPGISTIDAPPGGLNPAGFFLFGAIKPATQKIKQLDFAELLLL